MLLATAATIEQIKNIIAQYYYTTPDKIDIIDGYVYNNGRKLSTTCTQARRRYRFENAF